MIRDLSVDPKLMAANYSKAGSVGFSVSAEVIMSMNVQYHLVERLNRRFANQLGWKLKYSQIKHVLRLQPLLPSPAEFAEAVAVWQLGNRPLEPDGLMGPRTWKRMRPRTRMDAPARFPLPAWLRMNTATRVRYNLAMRRQGPSPICWVVCMAMMLTYRNRTHVPASDYTVGGADPANSSSPNPAQTNQQVLNIMRNNGFEFVHPQNQRPTEDYLANLLRTRGPLMLFHYTTTLFNTTNPNRSHAVVITGIDTRLDFCYVNNPWGTKDEQKPTDVVLNCIEQRWAIDLPALSYLT